MKQTALEFYRNNLMALVSTGKTDFKTELEIFEQANKMFEQQIIDAWFDGVSNWDNTDDYDAKHYYEKTFNKQ